MVKNIHDLNSWATADASANFESLWAALTGSGLLASIDESLVWLLSERLAQYVELREACHGKPFLVLLGSGSEAPNPLYRLRDQASADIARLLRACGCTPLSRRGLRQVRDTLDPLNRPKRNTSGFAT